MNIIGGIRVKTFRNGLLTDEVIKGNVGSKIIIRNKLKFITAYGIFILVLIMNRFFPHEEFFGKPHAWAMSIPIQSPSNYNPVGLATLAVLCIGIYLLATSLEKYRARIVVISLIVYSTLPVLYGS
jgi:hypothetical protein